LNADQRWFSANNKQTNKQTSKQASKQASKQTNKQTNKQDIWCHFDKHLNFDKHISNVFSLSYLHIRALRHIRHFLDSETFKSIACAIVGSIIDYANSIFTGISSRNIHRLQHIQNSWARVATRSTTNTT